MRARSILVCLLLSACGPGDVAGIASTDAEALSAYDPELDFGEPLDPPQPEEFEPFEPLDPVELPDPGPAEEDLTDLETSAFPLTWSAPDGGASVTLTCSAQGWRDLPGFAPEFERRWPDVAREALLYARCGDTTGNQRLETPLSALVAMYEATAHPEYALRFLRVVEALRAAAVRNGGGYIDKDIRETIVPSPRAGARCVNLADGRALCLSRCDARPARRVQRGLADMYLAEPVLRGLRLILQTDPCYLPASSGLRARALRHWAFFRAALWTRWRAAATNLREGQFHILARYGEMALQVCLRDPSRESQACALARRAGGYLRSNLIAHPGMPSARIWGSSTGGCNPRAPNLACHTIGGACDGNPGEAAFDCRGPGPHPRSTCWRTFCNVTDVSHANTVVGFAVDLHRHAPVMGTAAFTDAELRALGATLRDVIWCGNPSPAGPYASSVFIDGFNTCGEPAPRTTPKRDQQRRALALGWFRLGRTDPTLLPPMISHAEDLLRRTPTRDRQALATHAELARALAPRIVPEGSLLGPGGCAMCPAR